MINFIINCISLSGFDSFVWAGVGSAVSVLAALFVRRQLNGSRNGRSVFLQQTDLCPRTEHVVEK